MASKPSPPPRPGTSRASKSTAGKATPMPRKRTPYTTPRSGGNQLGNMRQARMNQSKGAPSSATQVKR